MTESFGHEKLIVYQKGMRFAVFRGALLERKRDANGSAGLRPCSQRSPRWPHMPDTLHRTLSRTLNRPPYSDTLHRLA